MSVRLRSGCPAARRAAAQRSQPSRSKPVRCTSALHRARGEDGAFARIGGRMTPADFGPGVQILHRIDDAATELAIDRAGSVATMLFERAGRQAEMRSEEHTSELQSLMRTS